MTMATMIMTVMIMGMAMTGTITGIITTTEMTVSGTSLLRLMTWLSPAFPVGAFAYSGGLEAAVREGHVADPDEFEAWIDALMRHGTLWNDLVFAAEAWRVHDQPELLAEGRDLAQALAGSAERLREISALGEAFLDAARQWPNPDLEERDAALPYAIAVGAVSAGNGIALEPMLAAFLHAAVSQLVSGGIRLGVCGQTRGVAILARLEPQILVQANRAAQSTLDDLGGATVIADIMAMRHETLYSRLFRS
jgi:urease accessory protein